MTTGEPLVTYFAKTDYALVAVAEKKGLPLDKITATKEKAGDVRKIFNFLLKYGPATQVDISQWCELGSDNMFWTRLKKSRLYSVFLSKNANKMVDINRDILVAIIEHYALFPAEEDAMLKGIDEALRHRVNFKDQLEFQTKRGVKKPLKPLGFDISLLSSLENFIGRFDPQLGKRLREDEQDKLFLKTITTNLLITLSHVRPSSFVEESISIHRRYVASPLTPLHRLKYCLHDDARDETAPERTEEEHDLHDGMSGWDTFVRLIADTSFLICPVMDIGELHDVYSEFIKLPARARYDAIANHISKLKHHAIYQPWVKVGKVDLKIIKKEWLGEKETAPFDIKLKSFIYERIADHVNADAQFKALQTEIMQQIIAQLTKDEEALLETWKKGYKEEIDTHYTKYVLPKHKKRGSSVTGADILKGIQIAETSNAEEFLGRCPNVAPNDLKLYEAVTGKILKKKVKGDGLIQTG